MDLTPLTGSSNLTHMGYDADARVLAVRFGSGHSYRYADVPAEVHQALLDAHEDPEKSLGKEFHRLVRSGGFKFEKVPE